MTAAKVVTFILVLAANAAIAVVCGLFLLLTLNGFSESDAMWGIIAFVLLALLISAACAGMGAVFVHLLMFRRKWQPVVAVLAVVPIFIIVGSLLNFLSIAVAAIVANMV